MRTKKFSSIFRKYLTWDLSTQILSGLLLVIHYCKGCTNILPRFKKNDNWQMIRQWGSVEAWIGGKSQKMNCKGNQRHCNDKGWVQGCWSSSRGRRDCKYVGFSGPVNQDTSHGVHMCVCLCVRKWKRVIEKNWLNERENVFKSMCANV